MLPEFPSAYQRWACAREGASRQSRRGPAHNEIEALASQPRPDYLGKQSSDLLADVLGRSLGTQWSPFEEDQLRSALARISAVSRENWLRVGLAIHYEWGPRGRPIWDEWSQTAPEKYDEANQERTWESFARPYFGRPITLRSIYHMASEAGWKGYQVPPPSSEPDGQGEDKSQAGPEPDRPNNSDGTGSSRPDEAENIKADGSSDRPNDKTASTLRWHGEQDPKASRKWLVKGLLPETGCGLISGQWGTGKTFVALDLAAAVMLGKTFAGLVVKRRGGVLFLAAEGALEIPIRLAGLIEGKHAEHKDKLPIAWSEGCPILTDNNAVEKLTQLAQEAADRMHQDFRLPLALIIIDTMSAAAGFKDENSSSEGQQVMNVLNQLSSHTGALALACDHFGKAVETGTRGTSAKEAAADVLLACLGDKTPAGNVVNLRVALRKLRGGATGAETAFRIQQVDLGQDEDGEPITTGVVEWSPVTINPPPQAARGTDWPKSTNVFRPALLTVLKINGTELRTYPDGPTVRAVVLDKVHEEFNKRYAVDGSDPKKASATRRQAFSRSRRIAQDRGLIEVREIEGTFMVWIVDPDKTGSDSRPRATPA
jgi:hypothetical protein